MPPRTQKQPSKKTMAKARRQMAKTRKSKAARNMDTFFYKAKSSIQVLPKQGVTVANYVYNQIALMDSSTTWSCTQLAEFKLYASLYDKVRINSVKVRVVPKANVLDQVNAQNEDALNVSGSGMAYHVIDRDGIAPSNVSALLRYPSVKRTSVLKPFTRSYAIRWPTGTWLDCQNIYSETSVLQRLGCFGGITVYAENILEEQLELFNEGWATFEMEWNCVFQGKTSAALSLTEDGSIKVTPHDTIANLVPSDVLPVYGGFVSTTTDNDGATVEISDRGDHSGPTGPPS